MEENVGDVANAFGYNIKKNTRYQIVVLLVPVKFGCQSLGCY